MKYILSGFGWWAFIFIPALIIGFGFNAPLTSCAWGVTVVIMGWIYQYYAEKKSKM